ncbi:hypothetical protein SAMN04488524_3142 [Pedobacter africanus]|uniref:Uncharacterized protein n=1 Tax=Pedobacter africanus TaxID=151894 RepID=A0A1W2CR40_9SPHI|nr:hypothetical protein SAMN04488524_3142 [Pedobacter africanus]
MLRHYNLTRTEQGSYLFTTDAGCEYTAFFTSYQIFDEAGNSHTIYNFGFDRNGTFDGGEFQHSFDRKIKATIVYIIKEFFRKNDSKVMVYFCYPDDKYARHRSNAISKFIDDLATGKEGE